MNSNSLQLSMAERTARFLQHFLPKPDVSAFLTRVMGAFEEWLTSSDAGRELSATRGTRQRPIGDSLMTRWTGADITRGWIDWVVYKGKREEREKE